MRIPDEQIAPWFSLLLGGEPPEGARAARRQARARARARGAVPRRGAPRRRPRPAFDRLFITHELPEEIEEATVRPENGSVHLPAVIAEAFGRSRSEARRTIAQGGVKLDGEPVPPTPSTCPRPTLDGRVLQLGKRHFRRLRVV